MDTQTSTAFADLDLSEVEAAVNEGLLPIDNDSAVLVDLAKFNAFKQSKELLDTQMNEIRDRVLKHIVDNGGQALTRNGKVVARRSIVRTARTDTKTLKAKYPQIHAELTSITEAVRFKVEPTV